jgi:PhzF family phenazine biosynthesis protein
MTIKIYTVDVFTNRLFRGNTCAVCVFPEWPGDDDLLKIAQQNGFAETAYIVPHTDGGNPELRWFTTSQEVKFCGYGTIAAGYVYLTHVRPEQDSVVFATRQYGLLPVERNGQQFQISAPEQPYEEHLFDEGVFSALGGPRPTRMVKSARGDLLIIYNSEAEVRAVSPNFDALMQNSYFGYVPTSPGTDCDYTYRYFSPRMPGVWEDPVNGASHSTLAPYWSAVLGKKSLHARAVSTRGGDVYCRCEPNGIVKISGDVTPYLSGELHL